MQIDATAQKQPWIVRGAFAGSVVIHILFVLLMTAIASQIKPESYVVNLIIADRRPEPKPEPPKKKTEMIPPKPDKIPDVPLPPGRQDPAPIMKPDVPSNQPLGKVVEPFLPQQLRLGPLDNSPIARDSNAVRLPASLAQQEGGSSIGAIGPEFAKGHSKPTDPIPNYGNISKIGWSGGTGQKETSRSLNLGKIGSNANQQKDTALDKPLADAVNAAKKTQMAQDTGTGPSVKWIKLPSIGPVAHLQPRCMGQSGYIYVGQYRLECRNDQIVAAWSKEE